MSAPPWTAALVQVGGPALLRELGIAEPDDLAATTPGWMDRGRGRAARRRRATGSSARSAWRTPSGDESRQAVAALQHRGIKVAMITGDARQVAQAVAAELGIDEVFAEVLPADKDKKVAELQARGLKVAMVGDGVNDSPALARAEVGIAIGAGTDVAMESAGVVLAGNDPRAVLSMVDLSRASYRKMWQNLVWATGYNIISVPLAAGVLAFAGVVLSPAAGAVLMSPVHDRRGAQRPAAAPAETEPGPDQLTRRRPAVASSCAANMNLQVCKFTGILTRASSHI